ncbi:hypothetical protein [Cesiribacter sp. SM1]|uniref:hypothetical protein n=1 Tax=Cesiribacter sp. SM1 TaxID=2861196 RepID=UPI001CD5C6B1|nr:hypothetical protein [Cesiribacter sp. SM1]
MKLSNFFFAATLLMLALGGCIESEENFQPTLLAYYKPVYASEQELFKIQVQPVRSLHDPGRIYTKGTLLIINERFKGFHLIDNADPANPKPLMFLEVPGAVNMAMQGQYLYADNVTDLITIDLSDLQQIKEVNRQKDVFEGFKPYPLLRDVGFECVDKKKGIVVGWELADMPSGEVECWR